MYNERKESFSFRDIIIQALFVILFIFILIWFFPSKSSIKNDINDAIAGVDITVTEESTRIFNENVNSMKEAAKSYFTLDRLPANTGDKVVMTLSEMLQKKIILPFVDHEGKQCDLNNSFVEIVKMDDEYIMKINLECGEHKDYVLVHMGCYNYCETDICEKKEDDKKSTTPTVTKPRPTTPKPTPNKPVVQYEYEYKKDSKATYSPWSSWSSWSTTKVEKNNLRDVRTTTETSSDRVFSHYETVYKTEDIYETRTVPTNICESYYIVGDGSNTYKWVQVGTTKTPGTSTSSKKYVEEWGYDSLGIPVKTGYYKILEFQHQTKSCNKYKTETQRVKVGTKQVPNGTRSVYKTKETKVTKYSYRTRTLITGNTEYKWSVNNDKKLLDAGYVKTGKKRTK